jgi:hypothetical protein
VVAFRPLSRFLPLPRFPPSPSLSFPCFFAALALGGFSFLPAALWKLKITLVVVIVVGVVTIYSAH